MYSHRLVNNSYLHDQVILCVVTSLLNEVIWCTYIHNCMTSTRTHTCACRPTVACTCTQRLYRALCISTHDTHVYWVTSEVGSGSCNARACLALKITYANSYTPLAGSQQSNLLP